jgi:hypothetical protein
MRQLAIVAVGLAITVAGCGGGESERPGEPSVYDAIEAETDCQTLQESFDRAEVTSKREGGTAQWTWSEIGIAYMKAADERMEEVGCYG